MTEPKKDTMRSQKAVMDILDGRDPIKDLGDVMVTLEHTVSTVLLMVMHKDARKAANMLNEGLVEGIELRLAYYGKQRNQPNE